MMTKKILNGKLGSQMQKASFTALLLLSGNLLSAQDTNKPPVENGFPYLEVFGSAGVIILLIVIAWFMGAKQTRPELHYDPTEFHAHGRKHFEHPNDPHFRKLKRKTS